uniref:Sulfotransferase family protein n=1 Tax=Candidatus Kentrum eta TaxID=2126337 RepID=A0A450UX32_9GAMM|nr:MAG: hypothetical protein BECKH772A_GA0070896_101148 [Candidatus Kentron sp. H]VFJ97668.1 MAG: hypothetical protein BECKH772B_GA0070898_101168 [Candidatus Kentron sp. H]VFK02926.1 MAG: hypothetical protein BECKH772C_GA0070978_101088 [Candidatus Kentron sp. H]
MHERDDLDVLSEPFSHLYYFKEKRAKAVAYSGSDGEPGDYGDIKGKIIHASEHKPVFFKDMCYHCHDHLINDDDFLKSIINTFLIRDPAKSIPSHFNINPNATLDEMGYEKEYNILHKVVSLTGHHPLVIDAQDLIENPRETIKKYCDFLELPFMEDCLSWEAGYKSEWNTWKGWHESVSSSRGIERIESTYKEDILNNEKVRYYYDHHFPFYNKLSSYARSGDFRNA